MFLVSACLLGFRTRYDGSTARLTPEEESRMKELFLTGQAVPVCPEQLAGLPTPRQEIEFRGGDGEALLDGRAKAFDKIGEDCSKVLIKGAEEVLRIARLYRIECAVLKNGSPSCGVSYVYIGGKKTKGEGVTAAIMKRAGMEVKTIDSV